MDKLDKVFEIQKQLDGYIAKERGLEFTREQWIQKRCLALLDEVCELLNEINYKWWKNPKPLDEKNIKEEIVDIFHFFLGICNDAGLSASELFEIYLSKNEENYKRQTGQSAKAGYELSEIKGE